MAKQQTNLINQVYGIFADAMSEQVKLKKIEAQLEHITARVDVIIAERDAALAAYDKLKRVYDEVLTAGQAWTHSANAQMREPCNWCGKCTPCRLHAIVNAATRTKV